MTEVTPLSLAEIASRLQDCLPADRSSLRRRLGGLQRRARRGQPHDHGREALGRDLLRSCAREARRRESVPTPRFDLDLPVVERREEIARAIADHQVVVICGETGSGKSTQLPKICMELGRGVRGMIAHTQPRRLAARTLATRIAEELGSEPGAAVGYKIRFTDRVGPLTCVKLVTDGMLLAEIQGDRELEQYDTIIIDEAHERSLNIDFLLGYLKQLLPRRPDLKVIITSATIDPERFSRHFDDAPIVHVSGRTYPVEIRYRPLADEQAGERDVQKAVGDAVEELCRSGPGDVLVFLTGERDIRETAEYLRKHHPPHTEVLPLYARLSAAEQQRVFAPHRGRRIVLATNVAETSITVPGIRYVVDTGWVRLSRYSHRTKVQRLPIEPVSQASANQRAGRCGRTGPGVCIRLYSEEDFADRPEFTDPEILRTNLAAVILQMKAWRLGDVEEFPFVEPPERKHVNDGYRLLQELGAVDDRRRLTRLGGDLARLPVDPRIGRMLLEAARQSCLDEVLVIASALSVQDPRERPLEARQAADEAHARYADEQSDFVAYLNLWRDYREQRKHLSRNKLRQYCRERFLSPVRMRDWEDIHGQLRELMSSTGQRINDGPAEGEVIHRALLSGLLSNVARRDEEKGKSGEYLGARGNRLQIFPGSGLFRKPPKWIVAAELVETRRLYARTVAAVRPGDIEAMATHLLSRSYGEPYWDARRGRVVAPETVSLYGLVLASGRKADYAAVDPTVCREIFIRRALVDGDLRGSAPFLEHNHRLIEDIEGLEARTRRRDVLVDADARFAFYAERIPRDVTGSAGFHAWYRQARQRDPQLLKMTRETLMQRDAREVTEGRFPERLEACGLSLPLDYHFRPGDPDDGVTVRVPLAALNQLRAEPFEWLVPGLVEEKAVALIKALPKRLRKNFVPAPEFAEAFLRSVPEREGSMINRLRLELQRMTGVDLPVDAWDDVPLPDHLRMNFRLLDGEGNVVAEGRDLEALQRGYGDRASASFSDNAESPWERAGLTRWDFGDLPEAVKFEQAGAVVKAYPAVMDRGRSVDLSLMDSEARAREATRAGVRRLFLLELGDRGRYLRRNLPEIDRMCLLYAPVGSCDELKEDLIAAALERTFMPDGDPPRTEKAFRERLREHGGELLSTANELCDRVGRVLAVFHEVRKRLKGPADLRAMESVADIGEQLENLVYSGFVAATPAGRLADLPRYLEGIRWRLDKLQNDPGRERTGLRAVRPFWEKYLRARNDGRVDREELDAFRWLIEEYRIQVFAQPLGTATPVSDKRLRQQWERVA